MSDQQEAEAPEAETVEPVKDSPRSKIDNLDDALREIDKLRDENAAKRVSGKAKERELEEKAAKWQEHLDSQKSEAEKLADHNAALRAKLEALEKESLRRSIASEFGLDADLVEFVDGADEDEMRARAEKLSAKTAKAAEKTDLLAGPRGVPIGPKKGSGGAFLESLLDK